MSEVEFKSYQDNFFKAYAKFAKEEMGELCYQSSEDYVNWLYNENPYENSSKSDLILGFAKGKVVGCIHKMRLMWKIEDQFADIPAVHDFMVAKKFRHGCGIFLLKRSFSGEKHVLVPGVAQNQGDLYRLLKCQQINSSWYRKVLNPVRGTIRLGLNIVFNFNSRPAFFISSHVSKLSDLIPHLKITVCPNEETIQRIIPHLNRKPRDIVSLHWTMERFRWRFFHPIGPKHLLIYKESESDIKDFLILSLGPRRGLNVGRVVEMEASKLENLRILIHAAEKIVRNMGGNLLILFSAYSKLNNMLLEIKYKKMKTPPGTYFYHKNSRDIFSSYSFNGSAGDHGFEALPTHY